MKRFIAWLIATPFVWAFLIGMIGMPFMKLIMSLNLGRTPLFIQTEEQAATVFRWMLLITGMMAAGFGIEISAIVANWDRFVQRLLSHGGWRRY
jgi:hypothetical protein